MGNETNENKMSNYIPKSKRCVMCPSMIELIYERIEASQPQETREGKNDG